MKLDSIALALVVIAAGAYALMLFIGLIAASSVGIGIPFLILFLIGFWLLMRVIRDRQSNEEDDYYERNVEK